MKKIVTIALLGLVLGFISCGTGKDKEAQQITALENRLYALEPNAFTTERADSLLNAYESYIKKHKTDTLAPAYLLKSASLASNTGKPDRAIQMYDQLIRQYPKDFHVPLACFMKAFVMENNVGDILKAKDLYLVFIKQYPDHELADDAEMAIKNLGKTPDQIIREIEARKYEDSVRMAEEAKQKNITGK